MKASTSGRWPVPATALLTCAWLAASAFPGRRGHALVVMPPFAVLTAAMAAWAVPAVAHVAGPWAGVWFLGVGAGYFVLALVRPDLRGVWAAIGFSFAALGVVEAHLAVADGELTARLPLTYAGATALAAAAFGLWRYRAARPLRRSARRPWSRRSGRRTSMHSSGLAWRSW